MKVPMFLTLSRIALAPVLVAMFAFRTTGTYVAAFVILLFAVVTDLLDGHLARARGSTSDSGRLWDPLADSFVFVGLFAGFVSAGWMPVWLFGVFLMRELAMHTCLRPYLLSQGRVLAADKWGKLKTFLQSIVGCGVLVAIVVTSGWPLAVQAQVPRLKLWAFCALLVVAIVSVGSLVRYTFELKKISVA